MRALPCLALLLLSACGSDDAAKVSGDEAKVTAKAVADVDAAMTEARTARAVPAAAPASAP